MYNVIIKTILFITLSVFVFSNPIKTESIDLEKRQSNNSLFGGLFSSFGLSNTEIKRNILFNGSRPLDVYYDKSSNSAKKPVIIFLYGGAWVSGDKSMYSSLATYLTEQGYVAVLPNYVLLPLGQIEDMVDDVYKAIQWTYTNISRYGGDPSRISISGHSAGAHLTALTLVKSSLQLQNKGKVLAPLPVLEKAILLNGPYDFGGALNTFSGSSSTSPTYILKKCGDHSVTSLGAKVIHVVSNGNDALVPQSSADGFMTQLQRVTTATTKIKYTFNKGYTHSQIVIGVNMRRKEECDLFLSFFKE